MRKIHISLLLLLSLPTYAKDREPAYEKGTITATLAYGFPNENKAAMAQISLGPYSAAADYQVSKRFSCNLLYSYMYSTSKMQNYRSTRNNSVFQFEHRAAVSTIMATGQYCYVNRGRVWMSMGLGLGMAIPRNVLYFSDGIDHSDELHVTHTRFMYRLRLADMKVRITRNFALYAGVGFGLDGFLNAGLCYNITGRE